MPVLNNLYTHFLHTIRTQGFIYYHTLFLSHLLRIKIKNLLHFTQCFQCYFMTGVHVGTCFTYSHPDTVNSSSFISLHIEINEYTNHSKKNVFHLPHSIQIPFLINPINILKLFNFFVNVQLRYWGKRVGNGGGYSE